MKELNEKGEFSLNKEELEKINDNFFAESVTENETKTIISNTFKNEKLLIDPHTAIAVGAVNKINLKEVVVILATAHPAKFF